MANSVPEIMDAAETLLQLQCFSRIFPVPPQGGPETIIATMDKATIEAGFPIQILMPNGVNTSTPIHSKTIRSKPISNERKGSSVPTPTTVRNEQTPSKPLNLHQKHLQEQRRWQKTAKTIENYTDDGKKTTVNSRKRDRNSNYNNSDFEEARSIATQTDENSGLAEIKESQLKIQELTKTIDQLKKELSVKICVSCENVRNKIQENSFSFRKKRCTRRIKTSSNSLTFPSDDTDDDDEFKLDDKINAESSEDEQERPKITVKNENVSKDMVPIGDGNACVPSRVIKQLDWSSYTNATRKLLTAVFPRRVLATHSLTGKRSPAFPNKPAKKKLDPALVNDIVQTVVERCKVPENVVRTSITTKCADESKMLRSRQKNKSSCSKENISPKKSDIESEESSH